MESKLRYLLLVLLSVSSFAFDHTHNAWNEIVSSVVTWKDKQSLVNYKKINRGRLQGYLGTLSSVKKDEFDMFSQKQQLAFLINAYNAFTFEFILKYEPEDSIKEIKKVFSGWFTPWDIKWFHLFGDKINLNHIEHGILRVKYKEPRIHFAINCASLGCPSLIAKAFTDKNLEEELQKAAIHFLNNKQKNYYNERDRQIYISEIFKWFEKDFQPSVAKFVIKYMKLDDKVKKDIASGKIKIDYTEYDWNLNKSN